MELNEQALKQAFKNFYQRKNNATAQSFEDGCHGVLGPGTMEPIMKEFVKDYIAGAAGEPVREVKEEKPYVVDRGGR